MTTATQRLPTISGYGDYASENYGVNCLRVGIAGLTLWFSYNTVIAFSAPGIGRRVRQNDWSTTTGKHLNWIDGGDRDAKKRRLPAQAFEAELAETLNKCGLCE